MHVGVERVREARIQSLKSDFDNLKMSEAESVDEFAEKFMMIVGRIRELGDAMDEKYVVIVNGVVQRHQQDDHGRGHWVIEST